MINRIKQKSVLFIVAVLFISLFSSYTVALAASDDASLLDLSIDGAIVEEFSSDVLEYVLDVEWETNEINISATANEPLATVSGDIGTQILAVGANIFTINVVSEDTLNNREYILTVNRADEKIPLSNDATLSDLTINETTIDNFASDVYMYYISEKEFGTEDIIIGATANFAGANISGDLGTKSLNSGALVFTITCTAEDEITTQDYTISVIVEKAIDVTSVSLDQNSLLMRAGDTENLVTTVLPADATNKNVTYLSENDAIASVDTSGAVTAVSAGTTNITVTTEDGSFTDTCEVTVVSPITDQKVAIVFGMADYSGTDIDLNGPVNDAIGMEAVLEFAGYTVYTYMDYTSAELLATVEATATAMPSGGTLLFAYSGHGGTGTGGAYLVGTDRSGIYISDLENALSIHTGTKEVFIDACYSGAFIAKDMVASKSSSFVTPQEDFNSLVISAFSQSTIASKTLDQDGYYVMTASSGDELSYEVTVQITDSPFASANLVPTEVGGNIYWIGLFDYGIHDGFGLYESTEFSPLFADSNNDDSLTWNELFLYSEAKANEFVVWYNANNDPTEDDIAPQNVQVYPLNSNHVVYAAVPVTGVTIDETLQLDIDASAQLLPVVAPANATNKNVSYISSDPTIASVDSTGLVTSVSVGYATITVTTDDGGFTDTCTVQSGYPVTSIEITPETQTMDIDDTFTLTTTISPANATNQLVIYSSDNESIATVDTTGIVTAHTAGTATITATTDDGGYTDTCVITVVQPATGVELQYSRYSLLVGTTVQLEAEVLPSDATNQAVTFESSDETVATVDAAGLVTSHLLGTATITVTTDDGGFTAQCEITVADELIESDTFTVNRDDLYFEDIPIGATAQEIIDSVNHSGGVVRILDVDRQEVTNDILVSTGYYVQLVVGGDVVDELRLVIEGEIKADGILNVIDYTLIRLHILEVAYLEGIDLDSADVNDDGIINVIDYTLVRLHILGVMSLYE